MPHHGYRVRGTVHGTAAPAPAFLQRQADAARLAQSGDYGAAEQALRPDTDAGNTTAFKVLADLYVKAAG